MILDIRYNNKGPEQIQHVRLTTIYMSTEELVITFQVGYGPPRYIQLKDINTAQTSND